MKYRITIWAVAGFLVASGWAVYFFLANKDLPMGPLVSTLVRLTCPIAIVGAHHAVSIYSALAANVAAYALVGLVVETLRLLRLRRYRQGSSSYLRQGRAQTTLSLFSEVRVSLPTAPRK